MKTNYELEQLILEWTRVHNLASKNPWMLLKNPGDRETTDLCVKIMKEVHRVEEILLEPDNSEVPGCPRELIAWIAANEDPACFSCMASSSRQRNHPVCNIKIKRWFDSREALFQFGKNMMPGVCKAEFEKEMT